MSSVYHFEAKVSTLDFGRMTYSVVYIPKAIRDQLPLKTSARLRVVGFINQQPFQLAILPTSRKRHYLLLSQKFLKSCKAGPGEVVTVEFTIDCQDAVRIPKELQEAIESNQRLAEIWSKLTPGKRRGLSYRIESAKREETRRRRVEILVEEIREFAEERGL